MENKSYRTEQFIIKKGHPLNEYLSSLMYCSNNLYNATNFHIRQVFTSFSSEDKSLHTLQLEVLEGLKDILPKVNLALQEKYERLCAQDLLNYQEALEKECQAVLKTRKPPKTHLQPSKEQAFIPYGTLDAYFKGSKNPDYLALPGQVNQAVMQQVYSAWKGYFQSLKQYKANPSKFLGRPKPPKYKPKGSHNVLCFSNQICKVKTSDKGKTFLTFPKTDLTFNLSKYFKTKLTHSKLVEVRAQKYYEAIQLEVVLEVACKPLIPVEEIENRMAIDLGVNNLATCISNTTMKPFILNGRPLKAINQFYTKKRAFLYSGLRINKQPKDGIFTTLRLKKLDKKHALQVKDYLHKATSYIVKRAVEHSIHEVIIGYNKGWKSNAEMVKSSKQTFTLMPYQLFTDLLGYKLNEQGIHLKLVEESYTSKASFLDEDKIPTLKDKDIPIFSGSRIKRGLYKTKEGLLVNSDVNAACNILRKHSPLTVHIAYKLLTQVEKLTPKTAKKSS